MDSLQSYESGHGDALHPIPVDPEEVFMGDHVALKTVTNQEFYQFIGRLDEKLNAIMSTVTVTTSDGPPVIDACPGPWRFQAVIHQSQSNCLPHRHLPAGVSTTSTTVTDQLAGTSTLPISGVSIPDLGRGPGAWRRAIKQWEEVDLLTKCALKDWPKHWYTGDMRTITGCKRSQRRIVFEEYERYRSFFFQVGSKLLD